MSTFDPTVFLRTAANIRQRALKENRITLCNDPAELRKFTEKQPDIKKTKYNNLAIDDECFSRAARFTKNSIDDAFGDEELKLLKNAKNILRKSG